MKTLTENELGTVEGGTEWPPEAPLPPYIPPVPRLPAQWFNSLSITPSFLNG